MYSQFKLIIVATLTLCALLLIGLSDLILVRDKSVGKVDVKLSFSNSFEYNQPTSFNEKFVEVKRSKRFSYLKKPLLLKVKLKNKGQVLEPYIFQLNSTFVERMELYDDDMNLIGKSGAEVDYNNRLVKSRYPSFRFVFGKKKELKYYIKLYSIHPVLVSYSIFKEKELKYSELTNSIFFGCFIGLSFALTYNVLVVIISLRIYSFLSYIIYSIASLIVVLISSGYLDSLRKCCDITFINYIVFWQYILGLFAIIFVYKILDFSKLHSMYKKIAFILAGGSFFGTFLYLFNLQLGEIFADIISALILVFIIISSLRLSLKKDLIGLFCFVAFAVFLPFVTMWLLGYNGFVSVSGLAGHTLILGVIVQLVILGIFLSLTVGDIAVDREKLIIKSNQKDSFFSLLQLLSREFYYPMLSISGVARKQLAIEKDESRKKSLGKIISQSAHVISAIRQVNSYILIGQKKKIVALEQVKLSDAYEQLINTFETMIDEKDIKISTNILDDNLKNLCVLANESSLIISVLGNILSNAIKFSYRFGAIDVVARKDRDEVCLSIIDYGIGLSSKQVDKISDNWVVSSTKGTEGEKGTGLGLSIIRIYMDQFGGRVEVYGGDKSDRTEFRLYLKKAEML